MDHASPEFLPAPLSDTSVQGLSNSIHASFDKITADVGRALTILKARQMSGYKDDETIEHLTGILDEAKILKDMFYSGPANLIVFLAPSKRANTEFLAAMRRAVGSGLAYRYTFLSSYSFLELDAGDANLSIIANRFAYTRERKFFFFAVPDDENAAILRRLNNVVGVRIVALDTRDVINSTEKHLESVRTLYSSFESSLIRVFGDIIIPRCPIDGSHMRSAMDVFCKPIDEIIRRVRSDSLRLLTSRLRSFYLHVSGLPCLRDVLREQRVRTGTDSFCAYDLLAGALLYDHDSDSDNQINIDRSFFEDHGCTFSDFTT